MMRTPILMYHEVAGPAGLPDGAYASWSVTREQFRAHLDLLEERGYTGMSVGRWLEVRSAPPAGLRPVVLTFDDGFRGNVDHAIPALCERGWTATFFVISTGLGVRPYAAAAQWRGAVEAGMEVGSHTASHPFMGPLSEADARRELAESREALENATGVPVRGFSWPNGDVRPDGRALLRETGYAWAATSRAAFATARTEPYDLPRLAVRSWHDARALEALLDAGLRHRTRMAALFQAKRMARGMLGRDLYARWQMKARGDAE